MTVRSNRGDAIDRVTVVIANIIESERLPTTSKIDPRAAATDLIVDLETAKVTAWETPPEPGINRIDIADTHTIVAAPHTGDSEVDAIGFTIAALDRLTPDAQDRVLGYLSSRLGVRDGPGQDPSYR